MWPASWRCGLSAGVAFNPRRRHAISGVPASMIDAGVSPVDVIFTARSRYGWLPRGGDE